MNIFQRVWAKRCIQLNLISVADVFKRILVDYVRDGVDVLGKEYRSEHGPLRYP